MDLLHEIFGRTINIEGLVKKNGFCELLDIKCVCCGEHICFAAYFKSDRIHLELICDECKKQLLPGE